MPACPVCQYHNPPEANKCERCNWSMQKEIEISSDHEILTTCIPTLIKQLEDAHQINNRKLGEIQAEIAKDKEQTHKHFLHLEELINELQSLFNSKNNPSPDIAPGVKNRTPIEQNISSQRGGQGFYRENNLTDMFTQNSLKNRQNIASDHPANRRKTQEQIDKENELFRSTMERDINDSPNLRSNLEANSLYRLKGDRSTNIDFNPINELQEDSLYASSSNDSNYMASLGESSKTHDRQENNTPNSNHNGDSYQNFYKLIKKGEFEVIKVTIPQETLEKARSGTQSQLEFNEDKKGNYWIVKYKNTCCLIPQEKLNINPYKYTNFQRVFDCQSYREDYQNFELIEPAMVVNYDTNNWRLETKGKIKFI